MKQYYVYKMEYELDDPEYIAIKNGFSFPAFFFGVFWLLKKRLWEVILFLIGFYILEYIWIISYYFWIWGYILLGFFITGSNHTFNDKSIHEVTIIYQKLAYAISYVLAILSGAFIAVEGNDFLRTKLSKKGYTFIGLYETSKRQAIIQAIEDSSETDLK
ncbi:MAG: DUF2628 domain-containing protein [Ignavibacteria bacterium]|nr:DUF2628 domain-containing protein [Ignavibacteria bacterium]